VISAQKVRAAAGRAAPFALRTPVLPAPDGTALKLDLLQPTGSFKVRGYFAAALALAEEERRKGLLTVSAGNAAAACAYVANRLGVPCRVVMFETAPAPKLEAVRRWGGEPVLMSREQLFRWMAERGWESQPEAFLHPHTDEEVAAGHGGVGLELLDEVPGLKRVVVPVGGGGLVTGVAAAVKPQGVEVVGVQSDGYPLWPRSIEEGKQAELTPDTIADGTAAPFNALMFERLKQAVDRWIVVPEPRLKAAIAELASLAKVVPEGAGALAYAALEQLEPGPQTAALVTGGNIDPKLLGNAIRP
jgi:threonine dehydratase